tara:strand:- start:7726 stop:8028 length:303 start_codon:yes stop_codon:yes gene_type:complete
MINHNKSNKHNKPIKRTSKRVNNLRLILDYKTLSIEECSFIKVNSPCVYRDDIPPLENWFPIDFRKLTSYDVEIMRYDFPILFKKVIKEYHLLKKQKILN